MGINFKMFIVEIHFFIKKKFIFPVKVLFAAALCRGKRLTPSHRDFKNSCTLQSDTVSYVLPEDIAQQATVHINEIFILNFILKCMLATRFERYKL